MHKANSIGIGSIGVANQRTTLSGTAFMSSDKAIEIIDAPVPGTEVFLLFSFCFSFVKIVARWTRFLWKTDTWTCCVCVNEQLKRAAYDAQEEIRRLKQQLALKDRRIHELEEQLQRFKNSFIGDSTAWWVVVTWSASWPASKPASEFFLKELKQLRLTREKKKKSRHFLFCVFLNSRFVCVRSDVVYIYKEESCHQKDSFYFSFQEKNEILLLFLTIDGRAYTRDASKLCEVGDEVGPASGQRLA